VRGDVEVVLCLMSLNLLSLSRNVMIVLFSVMERDKVEL
jgi:hypothetical protein